ncbi:MAG: hypothetical protein MI748_07295, partial [Opitutales bacterium]|nr:hypothetical protein [Opitutales bacterium]
TELNLFELGFSIGGVEVERVSKTLATDTETLEVLLPYLDSGTHSLRIQWLRGQPKASLKINTIELQSLEGDDSDSDGIDDWQELRMAVDSDLDETTISTRVSPYCLEGTAGYLPELVISGHKLGDIAAVITPPTAYKSFSNKYYADVSLFADDATVINVEMHGGLTQFSKQVTWSSTNIVDQSEDILLRANDSLLLEAVPAGSNPTDPATISVYEAGSSSLVAESIQTVNDRFAFQFTGEHQSQTVTSYRVEASVGGQSYQFYVNVAQVDLGLPPSTVLGFQREWTPASLPSEVELETSPMVKLAESYPVENPRTFTLSVGGTGPQAIVARIDSDQDGI